MQQETQKKLWRLLHGLDTRKWEVMASIMDQSTLASETLSTQNSSSLLETGVQSCGWRTCEAHYCKLHTHHPT